MRLLLVGMLVPTLAFHKASADDANITGIEIHAATGAAVAGTGTIVYKTFDKSTGLAGLAGLATWAVMLIGLSSTANGSVNHALGGIAGVAAFLASIVTIKNSGYLEDNKK